MAQDTFNKVKLSGSTDGKQIKVVAIASAGTTIHAADASKLDEVWIWCVNSSSSAVKLTIQWGGTTSPDDDNEMTIPGESGPIIVVPGWILTNSLVVKAFAGTANVLLIGGYVNRITQG
jgi:hypothetical protein